MAKHQLYELLQKQSLPLDMKIVLTQQRLREWYTYWDGNVYASFSGGKDSTVLADIISKTSGIQDIPLVFIDTGLEYPEIRRFVLDMKASGSDIEIIKPTMKFPQVVKKYGYPAISKDVARRLHYAKRAVEAGREKYNIDYLKLMGKFTTKSGEKSQFNCERYKYLLDVPVKFSSECCSVMKKRPAKKYEKLSGRKPITATMAEESRPRKESWLINGCNAFESDRPMSTPMSFWTEQDVLMYIKTYNVPYCSVYGSIITDPRTGKLRTTGCSRTGCYACMFGCHLEKPENRFQMMKRTHPKLYNYCINGGEFVDGIWQPNKLGLGLGKVLDYIGVDYIPEEDRYAKLFE